MCDMSKSLNGISFLNYIDGDCLTVRDGEIKGNSLFVSISVKAEPHSEVYINSVQATEKGSGEYSAVVPLTKFKNFMTAENKSSGAKKGIYLYKLTEESVGRYRISSDDNIRVFRELTEGNFASIFDHPYLAIYKKAHELYGAIVQLNLFYELDDKARSRFKTPSEYFNLSMMTDRYKDEFKANASWFKLAFHARSEFPNEPYKTTGEEVIEKDFNDVKREIFRFAGEECFSHSTTTHWGSANYESVNALKKLGITSLTGYFELDANGKPFAAYYADAETVAHVVNRDFWVDSSNGMFFARIDSVLNLGSFEDAVSTVKDAANDKHRGGFVSIMIHEQHFYSDYLSYRPDFEQRVLESAKYLYEKGYVGTQIYEVLEANQD